MERRSGRDRRQRPTRWFDSLLGHRRRQRGRRQGESRNIYVDVYYAADLILVAVIFLLNLADAVLTLAHLEGGGIEQNPALIPVLEAGPAAFLAEKVFVVGLCLVALVLHKNFRIARAGTIALLTLYGFLLVWHLILLL